MNIKDENIATYGLTMWEQTGTIAFDFATYLEKLPSINGIYLQNLFQDGWQQIGFRFGKSLIKNSDTLNLDIVLSKKTDIDIYKIGYVSRQISKDDFLDLIVNFTVFVSNQTHFKSDEINFKQLENLEL